MGVWQAIAWFLRGLVMPKYYLAMENLALRQQLAVYSKSIKRPRLRPRDRVFWVWLAKRWPPWSSALVIVKPETVIRWHRQGFRLYWRWKSRTRRPGRPRLERELRDLIRRMSRENSTWVAPRIQSEIALLGHSVAERTVAKYIVRSRKPPSQTWRTFLENHLDDLASIDFFTLPTATFRVLYCFVVLRHDRRRVLHFNVTANPSASWTAQQIVEAYPFDEAPRYQIRDRDGVFAEKFQKRVKGLDIDEIPIAPRSPWQNPYCERLIGSIRRECLDHVIVLGEAHLKRILTSYFEYYHHARTHLSLDRNSPVPREVEPPDFGDVIGVPLVGGLHHRYTRAA